MNMHEINPNDLPDGHPLKDVLIKAKAAVAEVTAASDKDHDNRNDLLFDEINELRDAAKDEQEFCLAIHAVVESLNVATELLGNMRFHIRPRLLRMIAKTLTNKADGFDYVLAKSDEAQRKLKAELEEGDVEPES
jgi:hypothetical protein